MSNQRIDKYDNPIELNPDFDTERKSDNRLSSLYSASHSQMTALRDTEFKVVSLYYQVAAFVFAANIVAATSPSLEGHIRCLTPLWAIICLAFYWRRVHLRIDHDHSSYEFHLTNVRRLERMWFVKSTLSLPCNIPADKAGPGSTKSQRDVAAVSIALIVFLLVLLCVELRPWQWCVC